MKKNILIVVLIVICCVYLFSKTTYTAYESGVGANVNSDIAVWKIKINDENVTSVYNKTLNLDDVVWTGAHTNPDTVAPGSTGTINLVIDPTTTNVAIRYDFTYQDSSDGNILTVNSIYSDSGSLIRTGPTTFTGVFTLEEIETDTNKTLTLELVWNNDEANNETDTLIGTGHSTTKLINLNLVASQYLGETIQEYEG